MRTSCVTITVIIGTGVPVFAGQDSAADARALRADIIQGARVPVVAGCRVGRRNAARVRGARVVRARIPVVALQLPVGYAHAGLALVAGGAWVVVAARGIIREMNAAAQRLTDVIGAGVPVVAVLLACADADSVRTGVTGGTGVTVVAGVGVVDEEAALCRFT